MNDGQFNSSQVLTCIRLVDVNDPPELFTGANSTVDTMVLYREGQSLPLLLAPELEIRGGHENVDYRGLIITILCL